MRFHISRHRRPYIHRRMWGPRQTCVHVWLCVCVRNNTVSPHTLIEGFLFIFINILSDCSRATHTHTHNDRPYTYLKWIENKCDECFDDCDICASIHAFGNVFYVHMICGTHGMAAVVLPLFFPAASLSLLLHRHILNCVVQYFNVIYFHFAWYMDLCKFISLSLDKEYIWYVMLCIV